MFSQACVILFTGVGSASVHAGIPPPGSRHPLGPDPPDQAPPGIRPPSPGSRPPTPRTRHPPQQTPPNAEHAGRYGQCTGDVSCHDPGFIDNGYRDGQAPFLCHSTVTYSCHPGLYLRGSPHLTCQGDGTWNVAKPTCQTGGPGGTEPSTGEEDGDDNSTAVLLGVFLPLIFLVLIIILIVVLLRRRAIHPLDRIIAWWKRKTGSTDSGQAQQPNSPGNNTPGNQGNNTSSSQGNNASNTSASQNPLRRMIAWWEKKSPGGNDTRQPHELESNIHGNVMSNVTAPQNANAVSNNVYMAGGKEEFVNKVGVQGAEAPLTYSCPKEKEAGFSDPPPSYDMYYEEVNTQKGKLKT